MGLTRGRRFALGALAAAVIALAALVVITFTAPERYRVTAVFDQAFGLVEGGQVKAGGVDVGKIEEIELADDGLPRVTMAIDGSFRLRRGASADIRLFGLAGQLNRYVQLTQGRGPELDDGAMLGLARTDQPIEFDELLAALPPETRRDVGTVLERFDRATVGRGPDLERTLRRSTLALEETAALLDELSADGIALRGVVRDGRKVVRSLARDPGELQSLADNLAPVLETTAARERELTSSLELLPAGLGSTRRALDRLDSSIGDLRRFVRLGRPAVRELVPFSRELRPTLAAARPAVRETRRLADSAGRDLRALRPLLRTATPIARTLDHVAPLLNPVLDHVRASAPEVASFFMLLGDAAANYDAVGHGARISGILTGEAVPERSVGRSETGPGSTSAAGCLMRPFVRTPGVLEDVPWTDYERSFIGGGKPVESFLDADERAAERGGC